MGCDDADPEQGKEMARPNKPTATTETLTGANRTYWPGFLDAMGSGSI